MLKLFKRFEARDWLFMFLVVCFMVGSVYLTLSIPDYMTKVTTLVETGGTAQEVLNAGIRMLLCALGEAVCTVMIGLLTARVAASFSMRLRREIYARIVDFSMEEISNFAVSSLVTRSTNDVTQVQMVIAMGLQALLRAPIIGVWSIIKILGKGLEWSIAVGVAVILALILIGSNILILTPRFKIIQKLTDKLNRITSENLTGIRVVRAYNAEEYQIEKFTGINAAVRKFFLFIERTMAFVAPGMQLIMNGTTLAIYWIGAYLINNASMTDRIGIFSNLVVFMAYAMQIIMAFMMIGMIFILIPRAQVSANRINEVLDSEVKIHDGPEYNVPRQGMVEFRDVSFNYPGAEEPVLEHISFKADRGETIAIIGSTGCGKSTLINLIPRFYDATSGQVLVDGTDVKEYVQKELHDRIGYVSQKAMLFKGTIASNIDYANSGEEASDEQAIIHALSIAQGQDILEKEEKGIYAEVAQGGSNFSGGQKQRISIARAIFSKPDIFIFDDSFSALDYKTDRKLRSELRKETAGATIFIVAQRISTVKDADQIIVLDEGKIAGIGKHADLLAHCDVYQQIAYSQLSKEELENGSEK